MAANQKDLVVLLRELARLRHDFASEGLAHLALTRCMGECRASLRSFDRITGKPTTKNSCTCGGAFMARRFGVDLCGYCRGAETQVIDMGRSDR